jgi:predicted phosphodiesterase
MRYALISDIHSNVQAWKKVLEDIRSNSVDKIICLGDIIGYGPNPSEIMRSLRNNVDAFVLGNHDAAVCGKLDISLFNDDARLLLEWTRKQLSEDDLKFMGYFPLTLIGDGFMCAHGSFVEPANFDYVGLAEEALPSWKATDSNLLIVGHTHEPALFVLGSSGVPRTAEVQDFVVDPGKRYLVNIGSVGQPRGIDSRASYCIYDTETKSIYWRRVAFDLDAYRKALKATGLTLDSSYYMLPEAKSATGTPAKRRIVFTPPKSPEKAAHDVIAVQDLKSIPPRKKKIPLPLISVSGLIVLGLALTLWMRTHPALDCDGTNQQVTAFSARTILPLARDKVEPRNAISGWITHVDNRYHQRIGVNLDTFNMPFVYLISDNKKEALSLSSPWIAATSNQVWDVDASFQKQKDFSGSITLKVILMRDPPGKTAEVKECFVRTPEASTAGGWVRIHETFTIPEGGTRIQFRIEGKFKGTLLTRQMTLKVLADVAPATAPDSSMPQEGQIPSPSSTNDPWHQKAQ